jgi:hypothetical protein
MAAVGGLTKSDFSSFSRALSLGLRFAVLFRTGAEDSRLAAATARGAIGIINIKNESKQALNTRRLPREGREKDFIMDSCGKGLAMVIFGLTIY